MRWKRSETEHSYLRVVGRTGGYNLLTAALAAGTGVLLARWLGSGGRGDYAAVTTYFGLAIVFFELGLGSSVVYFVSKRKEHLADYVRTATLLFLPLAVIAGATSIAVGATVFGDSPPRRAAFMILPICIAPAFLGAPASFALQSLNLRSWNATRLCQPLMFLLLVLGAHALTPVTVPLTVQLLAISLFVQGALSWWLYRRTSPPQGRFQRSAVGPLLRFGLMNMSSTAPNTVNARFDQLVLALAVSSAALGQYAVAVSLSVLAAPLVTAFGYVAFPALARGEGSVTDTIRSATRGALLVSVVGVVGIVATGPFIVPLLFGHEFGSVVPLLLVLAPGAVVMVVNQVFGDVLRGLGRPQSVARCEWIGVAGTLIGLAVLVPLWGAMGAAITSTTAYLAVHAFLRAAVTKSARMSTPHRSIPEAGYQVPGSRS